MARQVHGFSVTLPPGSAPATAVSYPLNLPTLVVDAIRIRVPPGPSGQVGFAIEVGGQQIIPYQQGTWIIADNEVIEWTLENYPDSGQWSLLAYNQGAYPHTLQLEFSLSLLVSAPSTTPQPIPLAQLS